MNAQEILKSLEAQGVVIKCRGDNLGVSYIRGALSPGQKALIIENKAALLAYLRQASQESLPRPVRQPTGPQNLRPDDPKSDEIYREYQLPTGETLQVTKAEFDNVVEVYRMLWKQDQRNSQVKKWLKEKGMFELDGATRHFQTGVK